MISSLNREGINLCRKKNNYKYITTHFDLVNWNDSVRVRIDNNNEEKLKYGKDFFGTILKELNNKVNYPTNTISIKSLNFDQFFLDIELNDKEFKEFIDLNVRLIKEICLEYINEKGL